ncbi:hypothetical protein SDJN02_27551, partial [Cucurbita argyrosperma subsp. argyrosperma]
MAHIGVLPAAVFLWQGYTAAMSSSSALLTCNEVPNLLNPSGLHMLHDIPCTEVINSIFPRDA